MEAWAEAKVIPHLRHLLGVAQTKLRRKLTYESAYFSRLHLDGEENDHLTDATQFPVTPDWQMKPHLVRANHFRRRIRAVFPELVEFWEFVFELERTTGYEPPLIEPAEWAKPRRPKC